MKVCGFEFAPGVDMMRQHDNPAPMLKNLPMLTETGQVSMSAALQKAMGLRPGHSLLWKAISDAERRVCSPAAG